MAMEYFCCYHSYRKKLAKLSDQEVGRLFRALMEYSETGETQELTGRESLAFDFIAFEIDAAKERYNEKCLTNKKNGEKGANAPERPRTPPNAPQSKRESKGKSKREGEDILPSDDGMCFAPVISAWNSLPDPITKVYKIKPGSTRETMLKVRIRDFSLDSVLQAIENIRNSAFCRGVNNRGWVISFDWFLKPNNFQKVLEGNYNDRETKRTDNDRMRDELAEWLEEVHI